MIQMAFETYDSDMTLGQKNIETYTSREPSHIELSSPTSIIKFTTTNHFANMLELSYYNGISLRFV